MRKCWVSLAASLLLASPAAAAVVREQRVSVDVQPGGAVRERVSWRVRIDNEDDFARWSPFAIYVDENRRLVRLEAAGTPPGGRPQPVKRKRRDRAAAVGGGVLHGSQEVELVEFPAVPNGSELTLEYEVEERPYYRSGTLPIGGDDAVESLRVEVRAPGLHVRLADAPPGLTVSEEPESVVVTGALPARPRLEQVPSTAWPTLRYSWGAPAEWNAVGSWYDDLVDAVPRGSEAVRAAAQRLSAGVADRRQVVERLLAFVRKDVRYVAVEIGIGGYRPAAPEEVLTRRWGDCKDKAILLVDLLAAVGIEGRMVLVRSDDEGTIDAAFPSPDQFNHAIAAIPASALPAAPGAPPAAGAWLFLDATQSTGGLSWLSPAVAGQHGLVMTPEGGELVPIPLAGTGESERLTLTAQVAADGSAAGEARYELAGARAAGLARMASTTDAATVLARATQVLAAELPGSSLDKVATSADDEATPAGRITAALRLPALLAGGEDAFSLLLPARPSWPSPGITDDRTLPIALAPGVFDTEWRLTLPRAGCRLDPAAVAVDNQMGSFRQEARLDGNTLVVSRHSELRARQAPPAQFDQLKAVAAAEHRALRKRLRLDCRGS
jgi:transglutaminase superfamily protein